MKEIGIFYKLNGNPMETADEIVQLHLEVERKYHPEWVCYSTGLPISEKMLNIFKPQIALGQHNVKVFFYTGDEDYVYTAEIVDLYSYGKKERGVAKDGAGNIVILNETNSPLQYVHTLNNTYLYISNLERVDSDVLDKYISVTGNPLIEYLTEHQRSNNTYFKEK